MDLRNTSITGSFDDTICARDSPVTYLEADCGGTAPEVNCSCCSVCCNDDAGECEGNPDILCSNDKKKFELEHEERQEVCECLDGGSRLLCTDTKCQYCNDDGSVCYIRLGDGGLYGFEVYDESIPTDIGWVIEVEYIAGPVGDRFRLEEDYQNGTTRRVFVNDQECHSARRYECLSGFIA